jgi:hypothetical protein
VKQLKSKYKQIASLKTLFHVNNDTNYVCILVKASITLRLTSSLSKERTPIYTPLKVCCTLLKVYKIIDSKEFETHSKLERSVMNQYESSKICAADLGSATVRMYEWTLKIHCSEGNYISTQTESLANFYPEKKAIRKINVTTFILRMAF